MAGLRLAAAVAGVLGLGGVVGGLVPTSPSLRAGASGFVDDAAANKDRAHNTPSVAADPRRAQHLVVANRLDAPQLGCAVWSSDDGATSWKPVTLTAGLAAVNCFWPRVAFLDDGTLLVLYTELGGPNILPVNLWLQRYTPGLSPDGPPLRIAPDLAFHARMAVSGGQVWLAWVQAGPATADNQLGFAPGNNPVVVARSGDGGRTFSAPQAISEPGRRVIQPTVLAGPRGEVFVGALDLGDDRLNYEAAHDGQTPPDPKLRWRIVAWVSGDGGATFGPTRVVADDLPVPQLIIADLGPAPGFAIDPADGRVYATWDAGASGDARDVFVASSTDPAGARWTAPTRVGPEKGSQLLPAVAVGPHGRVDLVFYDRSRDAAHDRLEAAVVATSTDHGRTFRWAAASDVAFDSQVGLGAQDGVPLQGDNLAVIAAPGGEGVLAFWADTSHGTPAQNVQDLAVASVDIVPGGRRWPLLAVGAALVLTAAALFALGLREAEEPEAGA